MCIRDSRVHALELDNAPGVHLNSYFDDHPDHVLGQIGSRSGKFGPELTVRAEDSSCLLYTSRCV